MFICHYKKPLEAAKKTRKTARTWVTKAIHAVEQVLDKEDSDRIDIEEVLKKLNERENKLREAQDAVETLQEEDEIEADIEEASDYDDRIRAVRATATKKLLSFSGDTASNAGSASSVSSAKLPKLELSKFDGDYTTWQTFWDDFVANVDSLEVADINKFSYLWSLLVGDARKAIEGLSVTNAHYKVACGLLQKRFGKRERIVTSHIRGLLNLTSETTGSKLSQLRSLQDRILAHVRSLEALDINGSTYGIVLAPIILECLPIDVRMEWAREGEDKEGDLDNLLDFLDKEIERRQRAASHRLKPNERKPEEKLTMRTATASALPATTSSLSCAFCSKAHKSEKCWKVQKLSLEDR